MVALGQRLEAGSGKIAEGAREALPESHILSMQVAGSHVQGEAEH